MFPYEQTAEEIERAATRLADLVAEGVYPLSVLTAYLSGARSRREETPA